VSEGFGEVVLRAQAIATRTYALHRRAHPRSPDYDVEASTTGQVYLGLDGETPAVRESVDATRGQILTFDGEPILAAFHSAAGGRTATAAEVWGRDVPYLVSVGVPGEEDSPDTYWRAPVSGEELADALAAAGTGVGRVRDVSVARRTPSGRSAALRVRGTEGQVEVSGETLRRVLGPTRLRSTLFEVRRTEDGFVFVGSGNGHGVGMSQWGARARAARLGPSTDPRTLLPGRADRTHLIGHRARRWNVRSCGPCRRTRSFPVNALFGAIPLQAGGGAPPQSPIGFLLPMALIFIIFYFLLIRPQTKRQKEQEEMLKRVEKGDRVVTSGGLHGVVTGATDDVLTVEIGAGSGQPLRVKVDRARIDRVLGKGKGEGE
jgi:preprotein translocase YajC subunit